MWADTLPHVRLVDLSAPIRQSPPETPEVLRTDIEFSGHAEGAGIGETLTWLLTGPHGPSLWQIWRERYGPWAWARPEI